MGTQLLIAGMFRSGTTLLSNLLSDHPQGLVISDPFVYFFKHYRNLHLQQLGLNDWHPDEPTPDYFGGARRELFESLQAADFQERLPAETRAQLIADIREWKSEQHPGLCARLDELKATTFAEAYRELMRLAVEVYGDESVEVAGTKVSWSEEFLPAMARAFPEMNFVLPLRDLRAIVASQNSQRGAGEGHRPLLFYVRHWRKHVALAQHYASQCPLLKDRVSLLRYEDLVSAPDRTMETVMERAGLRTRALAVHSNNSSFAGNAEGVFTDSTERWRSVLSTDEIAAIESFAGPELALLGYPVDAPSARPLDCLKLDCEPRFEQVAQWLQPFPAAAYLRDGAAREREYAAEERRRDLLDSELTCSTREERDLFLVEGLMPVLRKAWRS